MRVVPAGEANSPRSIERCIGAEAKSFAAIFREAEARFGLPAGLVEAVARAESALNPYAVSPAGALGLMQLMPATARAFGVTDPFDPAQNVEAGARYLRHLLDRFGGDLKLALAAYNAGPGAVRRFGGVPPYRETRRYVEKVLALLSEAKTDERQEELRPSPGPRPALSAADGAPAGSTVLNSDYENKAPVGCAPGIIRPAAVRAYFAALLLAETLLRPGEAEEDERGWRA